MVIELATVLTTSTNVTFVGILWLQADHSIIPTPPFSAMHIPQVYNFHITFYTFSTGECEGSSLELNKTEKVVRSC